MGITIRLFRRRVGAIGRTGRDFVAELSREARAGPLGAQLERAVILLEILWGFRKPCVSFVSWQPSSIEIRPCWRHGSDRPDCRSETGNLCAVVCPVENCVTVVPLTEGVDPRTGVPVGGHPHLDRSSEQPGGGAQPL